MRIWRLQAGRDPLAERHLVRASRAEDGMVTVESLTVRTADGHRRIGRLPSGMAVLAIRAAGRSVALLAPGGIPADRSPVTVRGSAAVRFEFFQVRGLYERRSQVKTDSLWRSPRGGRPGWLL